MNEGAGCVLVALTRDVSQEDLLEALLMAHGKERHRKSGAPDAGNVRRRASERTMSDTKQRIRGLKEIMHPPVSVPPDVPAREALRVLLENRVPGVPVEENGKLVGFISDRHLLGSALPEYLLSLRSLSFVPEDADGWAPYFT
ncbi:MAG: CBS domain-containing protein [Rubrobacter sp.]|nr:CBS domain-containing protein [Rubrobacter sp.]